LDLREPLSEGIARITCQHLLFNGPGKSAVEDAMNVTTRPREQATLFAVAPALYCPFIIGCLNMSSAKLDDRQRAKLGYKKILHDLRIALVGLWTDFFPNSPKPSGEPSLNGHTGRIDMLASV